MEHPKALKASLLDRVFRRELWMRDVSWTKQQKQSARKLFDLALNREYAELIERINDTKIETPEEVWRLYEILDRKRSEMKEKYDYRYSRLIFLFARLSHERYLSLEELKVLGEEKYEMIRSLVEEEG
jgi:hypothetical protein